MHLYVTIVYCRFPGIYPCACDISALPSLPFGSTTSNPSSLDVMYWAEALRSSQARSKCQALGRNYHDSHSVRLRICACSIMWLIVICDMASPYDAEVTTLVESNRERPWYPQAHINSNMTKVMQHLLDLVGKVKVYRRLKCHWTHTCAYPASPER